MLVPEQNGSALGLSRHTLGLLLHTLGLLRLVGAFATFVGAFATLVGAFATLWVFHYIRIALPFTVIFVCLNSSLAAITEVEAQMKAEETVVERLQKIKIVEIQIKMDSRIDAIQFMLCLVLAFIKSSLHNL